MRANSMETHFLIKSIAMSSFLSVSLIRDEIGPLNTVLATRPRKGNLLNVSAKAPFVKAPRVMAIHGWGSALPQRSCQ